ncbi:MAG: dephospho-CoA kinase [Acetanaerobacterium sp.]
MGKLYVVGLTGPTGAGKTTVSRLLAQKGFRVIDADLVARQAVMPETTCLAEITRAFGEAVINADGSLDRRALGGIVFGNRDKLSLLEGILFPSIIHEIERQLQQCEREGKRLVILDAPTLFESGADALCDSVLVVTAPKNARLTRIMLRDNLSCEQALQRVAAQKDDAFYLSRANYVVDNGAGQPDYPALLDWLKRVGGAT